MWQAVLRLPELIAADVVQKLSGSILDKLDMLPPSLHAAACQAHTMVRASDGLRGLHVSVNTPRAHAALQKLLLASGRLQWLTIVSSQEDTSVRPAAPPCAAASANSSNDAAASSLQELQLRGSGLCSALFVTSSLTSLRSLEVQIETKDSDRKAHTQAMLCAALPHLQQLTALSLEAPCSTSIKPFSALHQLSGLRRMIIDAGGSADRGFVPIVKSLPQLSSLHLSAGDFSWWDLGDAHAAQIARLQVTVLSDWETDLAGSSLHRLLLCLPRALTSLEVAIKWAACDPCMRANVMSSLSAANMPQHLMLNLGCTLEFVCWGGLPTCLSQQSTLRRLQLKLTAVQSVAHESRQAVLAEFRRADLKQLTHLHLLGCVQSAAAAQELRTQLQSVLPECCVEVLPTIAAPQGSNNQQPGLQSQRDLSEDRHHGLGNLFVPSLRGSL